ncbi:4-hydroxy-tetrahydrodipicolinate synthase [mine drainage metagenome]|uniref:4-hydroxy-tetrahydrodipicolinate synthase n=1 Tax=mine drainage metagenome TaxID=410659 RepID=A0A1J5SNV2_9ZZZZ
MNTRIRGVLSPVVTPFQRDLSPDRKRFTAHCQWLLAQGASGLAVFGTTSEANSLSVAERISLFDGLLEDGIPAARLMPGTGCCALSDSVELTRHAVSAGAAGVLMLPPFYYKGVSEEGVFRNYAEIVERVNDPRLQIYLYHIPQVSQVPITIPLIQRLRAAYPGAIAGIKDSSGDPANLRALLEAFSGTDFDVFPGSELLLLEGLRHGGVGCITATGNVNPGPIAALCRDWRGADADRQQANLDATRRVLQSFPMVPAVKATIAHYSDDDAWSRVRPPLVELDAGQRTQLISQLDALGFAMPGITKLAA